MMQALAFLFALAAIVATGLPLIRTDLWWVRACDYPKPQMLLICLLALAIWLFVVSAASSFFIPVALLLVLATLWNAFLILPFTRLYPKQVAQASRMEREHCIRVLISNVLMENRDFDAVRRMIRAQDPDIVFLAETDQDWVDALEDVAREFPHVTVQPQDNHYGLMFMTRLAVDSVDLRWLVKDDTPSILARLRAGDGRGFVFYGLHPEPPLVGQDSDARDAELMLVAREMKDLDLPAIVAGDLNDVAWSSTTRLFRRTSGALDPRIGRGLYSSFHADYWFARWPLDHLFHTEEFELGELGLLPSVGSDHFPVFGNLCLALGPNDNDAPEPELDGDAEEVEEIIENGRKNHGQRRRAIG